MDEFKVALGVKCNFCHVKMKEEATKRDFANDIKPEKEITRKMMKMMGKINNKFFAHTASYMPGEITVVTCQTCHRGSPRPENTPQPK